MLGGQDADEIAGDPNSYAHSTEGDLPHEAAASSSRDHTADIIVRDLTNGLRADFPFLKEALTSFADNDGIVREGITFCGSLYNANTDSGFGTGSGTLGAVDDGFGNNYDEDEETKACGRNKCDDGSLVAILSNRIRALGYHVQHADLCKAKAKSALSVVDFPLARTCRLEQNNVVRESYECNKQRYEHGLDFFQVSKQCFGLGSSDCNAKKLEYLSNATISAKIEDTSTAACAWDSVEKKCYAAPAVFTSPYNTADVSVIACADKAEEKIAVSIIDNEIRRQPLYSVKSAGKVEMDDSVFVTGAKTGNCNTLRNYILALNGNAMLNAFRDNNIEQATDYWSSTLREARQYVKAYAATLKNFHPISLATFPEIEYESFHECPVGETDFTGYDTGTREEPLCEDSRYKDLAALNAMDSDAQYAFRKTCFCRNGQQGTDSGGGDKYTTEADDIYLKYDINASDCTVGNIETELPSVYQYCAGGFNKESKQWKNVLESLLPQKSRIQTFGGSADTKRTDIFNELSVRVTIDTTCGRLVNADNSSFMTSNKGGNCLPFPKLHEVIYRLEFETAKAGIGSSTVAGPPAITNTFEQLFCLEKFRLASTEFSFRQLAYRWNHPQTSGTTTFEPRRDSNIYTGFTTTEYQTATIVEKQRFQTTQVTDFCTLNWAGLLAGPVDRRDSAGDKYNDPYELFDREIEEAIFSAEVALAAKKDAVIDNDLLWAAIEEEITSDSKERISYAIAKEAADHFMRVVTTDSDDSELANRIAAAANRGIGDKCPTNTRVKTHVCVACASGKVNTQGDDPLGSDTSCDFAACGANQFGNSSSSGTGCQCDANFFVSVSAAGVGSCLQCGAAGNGVAASGAAVQTAATTDNTTCTCPASLPKVSSDACVACGTHEYRGAGDPVYGGDTTCDLCGITNKYANGAGACVQCPANAEGATNYAVKAGALTDCHCKAGYFADVVTIGSASCDQCPPGQEHASGARDTATVVGTSAAVSSCDTCKEDYWGSGDTNAPGCTACAPGYVNTAGDLVVANITAPHGGCTPLTCATNEGSQNNVCYTCPAGTSASQTILTGLTTALVHGSSGVAATSGTSCVSLQCAGGYYVSNHVCTKCAGTTLNPAGDFTAGPDTVHLCV